MTNILIGLGVLAIVFSMMVAFLVDIDEAIADAQHHALLDQLWGDE